MICWAKGHCWKYEGGLFAQCSRCDEDVIYVGDGIYAGGINETKENKTA